MNYRLSVCNWNAVGLLRYLYSHLYTVQCTVIPLETITHFRHVCTTRTSETHARYIIEPFINTNLSF